jgi:hypothetical protein
MDLSLGDICPMLAVDEEFCDTLMGKMTPLIFPYLLPELDHVIYVNRSLVFQVSLPTFLIAVSAVRTSKDHVVHSNQWQKALLPIVYIVVFDFSFVLEPVCC